MLNVQTPALFCWGVKGEEGRERNQLLREHTLTESGASGGGNWMLIEAASDNPLGSLTMYQAPGETLYRFSLSGFTSNPGRSVPLLCPLYS